MKKNILKFRAWDNNQMLTMPLDTNFGISRFFGMLSDDAKVMQYTGLNDKVGKEIYSGDILKTGETDKVMVVGWSERFASFVLNRDGWMFSHWFGESCEAEQCEVIGNIHQNKELLS